MSTDLDPELRRIDRELRREAAAAYYISAGLKPEQSHGGTSQRSWFIAGYLMARKLSQDEFADIQAMRRALDAEDDRDD